MSPPTDSLRALRNEAPLPGDLREGAAPPSEERRRRRKRRRRSTDRRMSAQKTSRELVSPRVKSPDFPARALSCPAGLFEAADAPRRSPSGSNYLVGRIAGEPPFAAPLRIPAKRFLATMCVSGRPLAPLASQWSGRGHPPLKMSRANRALALAQLRTAPISDQRRAGAEARGAATLLLESQGVESSDVRTQGDDCLDP